MPDTSEPGSGFFAFPRGARAGTCLHAILEDWVRAKGPLNQLTEAALTAHEATPHFQAALPVIARAAEKFSVMKMYRVS